MSIFFFFKQLPAALDKDYFLSGKRAKLKHAMEEKE